MTFLPPNRDSSWNYVILTDANGAAISLPPRDGIGTAVISVPSEQKLDKKTAAGKKGATVAKQGAEAADATIEYTFADHAWADVEPGLNAIDPRGPAKGGPFLVTAPFLPPGFEYVIVGKIDRGSAIFSKGVGKVRISVTETTFAPKGAGGGVGKAGGVGSSYTQALTEAQIAEIQAEIAVLRARNHAAAIQAGDTAVDEATYQATQEEIARNSKRIADLERKLARGLQFDPAAHGSETTTPTKPEGTAAPPGAEGKLSDVDGGSYDTTKNPDAPKGDP